VIIELHSIRYGTYKIKQTLKIPNSWGVVIENDEGQLENKLKWGT
jgi:hypothetical protein